MKPNPRAVEESRVQMEATVANWHAGAATEREADRAIRFYLLMAEAYCEALKRGG